MPHGNRRLRRAALAVALCLTACTADAAAPPPTRPGPSPTDPPSSSAPAPDPAPADGAHEVTFVADLGPRRDGPGRAVVETTWTTDGDGTVRVAVDTPVGLVEQHVFTDDEHWWWLHPEARQTVADAEWIHFDLDAIAAVGGELPDVVREARLPPPLPLEVGVGSQLAGLEVLAVEVVDDDHVRLTLDGVERAAVLRRRSLPGSHRVRQPTGAVDVTDLPGVLRW